LSANGPLATACDRIGSVQVTQDPMTRAAKSESLGIVTRMHKLVQIHMTVMTGRRQIAISFHRACWYFAGSWKPAMTSCTPITMRQRPCRMISREPFTASYIFLLTKVMASCCPSAADPNFSASRNLDAIGPRMIPTRTAGTRLNELIFGRSR
jgi:hypothetical protein